MESINQKSIDTLNSLLEINYDRIEGYARASKETNEFDLKNLFSKFAATSYECRQQLVTEVKKLQGAPVKGTPISGRFYRAWMDIKTALAHKDRKRIIDSCEFAESVALKTYEDALSNNPLGSHLHELIHDQYSMIKSDHDKVKTLRDALIRVRAA